MKIYAYYRISTKTQFEVHGIDMQVVEVKDFCSQHNLKLSGEYTDNCISGCDVNRPGLTELLSVLEDGDSVLVINTSRLWRSTEAKVAIQKCLKDIGADVISIEQPSYSIYSTDPNDFLFNGMMELLDQYERMTISMKLAKGRKARAKKGHKPCGAAPFGYKWKGNDIVVDFNNNLIIQDIFEKYIELKSLGKLKSYCDCAGYKTSSGKDFSKQALKNIIENDFYIGIVTYAGKKISGEHVGIIEKSLFDAANEILKR